MDNVYGAEQANVVRELTRLQFGFGSPHLLSEQGRRFLETMADLNIGLGDFVLRRGNRNAETVTRMMQCRSLPDMLVLQSQWTRDVADDYMKETARMAAIHGRLFGGFSGMKGIDHFFRTVRYSKPRAA